jgi:pyridinium-3,5-biscarboxylic acid mononucleotide sulfurtransferase
LEISSIYELDWGSGQKFDLLLRWFGAINDNVVVALSGGVDSAVVALAAQIRLGQKATAVTANCATTSEEELKSAIIVAKELGIKHEIVEYNVLTNQEFTRNDNARCYHCRKELALHLVSKGKEIEARSIVDGTHIDDLGDHRPGIIALQQAGVRHPLLEVGLNKSDIRRIAEYFKLSVSNKPANSCLASRIPHGKEITHSLISRVEEAESIIKTIFGVKQVRVRDHDELARIEVGNDELHRLFDVRKLGEADQKIKELGFRYVSVDMKGYRQGSLVIVK